MKPINLRGSAARFGTAGALALALAAGGIGVSAQDRTRAGPSEAALAAEKPFLDESTAAMDRMMAGMAAEPSGDVDRDFVAMMAPHHQGAIDMATAYLRHGRNEQLRRIAQGIIVEQ